MDFYAMKRRLVTMVSDKVKTKLSKVLSENPNVDSICVRDVYYQIRNEIPMDRAIITEMKHIGELSNLFWFDSEKLAFIRVNDAVETVTEDDHENKPQSI